MTIEARIKTKHGERIYRTGLEEISFGEGQLYLYYGETEGEAGRLRRPTGNTEMLEGAVVEVVKFEDGRSLEERDSLFSEFQEYTRSAGKRYRYK